MKTLSLITAIALSALSPSAQRCGEIHENILDESDSPMPFLYVIARAGNKHIRNISAKRDEFKIKPLLPGSNILEFSFIGCHSHQLQVHLDP